jgi:hypothetical protein
MPALVTDDGWRVEPMRIDYLDGHGPRRVIRVMHGRTFVGQCTTAEELAALLGPDVITRLRPNEGSEVVDHPLQ